LLVFAYACSHISGTHIVSAVTIGLWVYKQVEISAAVASGNDANIWVYFVGTPLGFILAALLYNNMYKD